MRPIAPSRRRENAARSGTGSPAASRACNVRKVFMPSVSHRHGRAVHAATSARPSHTAIRRISAGPIEQRRFGEWRMCASILSPTDAAIVRTLAASGKFDPNALTAEPALRLLGAVARLQGQAA